MIYRYEVVKPTSQQIKTLAAEIAKIMDGIPRRKPVLREGRRQQLDPTTIDPLLRAMWRVGRQLKPAIDRHGHRGRICQRVLPELQAMEVGGFNLSTLYRCARLGHLKVKKDLPRGVPWSAVRSFLTFIPDEPDQFERACAWYRQADKRHRSEGTIVRELKSATVPVDWHAIAEAAGHAPQVLDFERV